MKVLFLDVDGVLVTRRYVSPSRIHTVHRVAPSVRLRNM